MGENFTPGPWRREGGEIRYGAVVADPTIEQPADYGYDGVLIAESIRPSNLDLIAAAPDLYAACKAAALAEHVDRCRFWTTDLHGCADPDEERAKADAACDCPRRLLLAALAKARGEVPHA